MTDYSKGQIYKVQDNGLNLCYIGSTAQKLCKRMAQHRKDFKKYLEGKRNYTTVFEIFEEYGVENCKIIWIEDCACNSKKELEAREGELQKANPCVNKHIAGRSSKERYEDNKDEVLAKCKAYQEKNKECIKKKKKQNYEDKREYYLEKAQIYRDNHKEENKEYFKKRYENNKEEERARRRDYRKNNPEKMKEQDRLRYQRNKASIQRPYTCECGAIMCRSAKSRHEKTQKHQQYLQSLNQNNPQEWIINLLFS